MSPGSYAGINNDDLTAGIEGDEARKLAIGETNGQTLGKIFPSDIFSVANGLNDTGLIVGESGINGFAYDLSTSTLYNINDFDFSHTTFDSVLQLADVNNSGHFVGIATIDGVEHGVSGDFVPVPEPTTFSSAVIGIIVLVVSVAARRSIPCARNGRYNLAQRKLMKY